MKEAIGLSIGFAIFACTFAGHRDGTISATALWPLLSFALISAIATPCYKHFRFEAGAGKMVIDTRRELEGIKEEALDEMRGEVKGFQDTLNLVIADANTAREKGAEQAALLGTAIDEATMLERKLEIQTICADAMNGSRPSYEKLRTMVDELTGEKKEQVRRQIRAVEDKYNPFRADYEPSIITGIVLGTADNPIHAITTGSSGYPLNREEVENQYEMTGKRKHVFDTLYELDDKESISFIVEKIKNEQDLEVYAAAHRCLVKLFQFPGEFWVCGPDFWENYAKDKNNWP